MASAGITRTSEQIPNAQILPHGQMGSRLTVFLRETPKPFTILTAGASNQDFAIAPVLAVSTPQVFLGSRLVERILFLPPPPGGINLLQIQIGGEGVVTATLSVVRSLAANIFGFGEMSADPFLPEPAPVEEPEASQALRSLRRRRRVWKEWDV